MEIVCCLLLLVVQGKGPLIRFLLLGVDLVALCCLFLLLSSLLGLLDFFDFFEEPVLLGLDEALDDDCQDQVEHEEGAHHDQQDEEDPSNDPCVRIKEVVHDLTPAVCSDDLEHCEESCAQVVEVHDPVVDLAVVDHIIARPVHLHIHWVPTNLISIARKLPRARLSADSGFGFIQGPISEFGLFLDPTAVIEDAIVLMEAQDRENQEHKEEEPPNVGEVRQCLDKGLYLLLQSGNDIDASEGPEDSQDSERLQVDGVDGKELYDPSHHDKEVNEVEAITEVRVFMDHKAKRNYLQDAFESEDYGEHHPNHVKHIIHRGLRVPILIVVKRQND
mmetsp:Transcript_20534/g.19518  ORF Transcript_20534/g.19518 Transcript_20534/m.19518 type:complete len:333 (+) Transcript_20534:180-1178(+)